MKFGGTISEINLLYQVVQSVEKVSKKCIIRLSPEHIEVICDGHNDVQMWSKMKKTSLFTEYNVQSRASNIISAEVVTDALCCALRDVATNTKRVSGAKLETVMKLAKQDNQAVFVFETWNHDNSWTKAVTVSHSVKICAVTPSDMEKIKEPLCPEVDVHIITPPLKDLWIVFDRIKLFGSHIWVSANNSGELKLSVETDDTPRMETTWRHCKHPTIELDGGSPSRDLPDREQSFGAIVSAPNFLKFLSAAVIMPKTCVACICENHCLILYVYIGEASDQKGILTYYIPAQMIGNED